MISIISFGPVERKYNGYLLRVSNIIKSLSKGNNIVYVLEFSENEANKIIKKKNVYYIHLKGNGLSRYSHILKKILTFDPLVGIKFQIYSLFELFTHRNYIKKSDIIYVEGGLIPFGIIISKYYKKKVVLDTHCINKRLASDYRSINKPIYYIRKFTWTFLERFAFKTCDKIILVSEEEKTYIQDEYNVPLRKIEVIENKVSTPKIEYSSKEINLIKKRYQLENRVVVSFVGDLTSVQNIDSVNFILNELSPYFLRQRDDVTFLIIGKGNENYKNNYSNVVFAGFVENIGPYYHLSDLLIAPLRIGAGTKTKVIESVKHNKPILTTPSGAEGIPDNINITVVDIDNFKERLMSFLNNCNPRISNTKQ